MGDKSAIEWTEIPGFPGYEVSTRGQIRNVETGFILKAQTSPDGYQHLMIHRRKLRIHRAVLLAFVGQCPPGQEARHLNGLRSDNRLENLCWGTRLEQVMDKRRHGTLPIGEKVPSAVLSVLDVIEIRKLHGRVSLRELGRRYGVSHTEIRRAAIGMKWGHVHG